MFFLLCVFVGSLDFAIGSAVTDHSGDASCAGLFQENLKLRQALGHAKVLELLENELGSSAVQEQAPMVIASAKNADAEAVSSPISDVPATPSPPGPPNNAKCAGTQDDHSAISGTLDCTSHPDADDLKNSVTNCGDNLSRASFFQINEKGYGECIAFDSKSVLGRQPSIGPISPSNISSTNQLVYTVGSISHCRNCSADTGAITVKRLLCNTDTDGCEVFRVGVCIRCPTEQVFSLAKSSKRDATETELQSFYKSCVLSAFNDAGFANSSLKESHVCRESDTEEIKTLLRLL
jgi:hypothetical protein